MQPCTSAAHDGGGAPATDCVRSGHGFTDRFAAQKTRALARRGYTPAAGGASGNDLLCRNEPVDQEHVANWGSLEHVSQEHPQKVFIPGNRSNQDLLSDDVGEGQQRSAKTTDRFAAQKSRALARRDQHMKASETTPGVEVASSNVTSPTQQPPLNAGRNNFLPANRCDGYVDSGSPDQMSLQCPANQNSPDDALAQLISECESGGGRHMMRGEALDARRRAVPGLLAPSPADIQHGHRLVSTQPPPAHGGWLPWSADQDSQQRPEIRRHSAAHGMHSAAHGAPSLGNASSNVWAKGNAGNMITDRPTSRVLKPPGGGSSFVIGKW